ncbi:MAG: hypothetical protein FWH36_01340 [Lentimicrobiaceae bacterium]|nr:hypothetical protein [Lentimicrobiaceae bacterium]
MTSYVLRVNERNVIAKSLLGYLRTLSKTNDYVCIMPQKEDNFMEAVTLSEEEIERLEKSRNSGICKDISKLKEYINSQI